MNLRGHDARRRDRCGCGRPKDVTDYCCDVCYRAGHPVAFGHRVARFRFPGRHPDVEVLACPGDEFHRGAQFSRREFGLSTGTAPPPCKGGLQLGVWPADMVVLVRGQVMQVVGQSGSPQTVRLLALSLDLL